MSRRPPPPSTFTNVFTFFVALNFFFVFVHQASGDTSTATTTTSTTTTPSTTTRLPDTTSIDRKLTDALAVDHFFNLWIVFNNDDVVTSDEPFTILAPKNTAILKDDGVLRQPELVKKLLLDHVVLGSSVNITGLSEELVLTTLSGRNITLKPGKEEALRANNALVLESRLISPNASLLVLDNYLFPEDKISRKSIVLNDSNGTFIENVMEVLALLKSGVRVFQHFLSKSNVSGLLEDDEEYTVFVPTDHAFQRWHPIDWGFYPFSVPEFTENVIVNHFVRGKLKQENIKNGFVAKTLGGREITFKRSPNLTINGVAIVKGDTPLHKGNVMFIAEVLFVSESVVSRLHQQHRDKETPPLLAFPWFGAQFLSHAFLALERDRRFGHITRFLNLADLAPHVSGTGYTFFVPTDTAFEVLGLDKMPDNYLSTGNGLEILLNHFVKGRLYDRDLKNGTSLGSLGNKTIHIERTNDKVLVNNASIVESEVFVYNLGTMFYIDQVLFSGNVEIAKPSYSTSTTSTSKEIEVETIPEELTEPSGSLPDVLFADATDVNTELSTVDTVTSSMTSV